MRLRFSKYSPVVFAAVAAFLLAGCVHSPPDKPWDPIQPVNRAVFKFNRKADKYVLKPVAKGYDTVTPDPVQSSVGNFFANAHEPITIVNSLLQLNGRAFSHSLGRFLVNSTAGIGGLFDVASKAGIPDPDEDLGQTFGHWGVGRGPYLVLPLLGPSDGRDALGRVGDHWLYPITYLDQIDDDYQYVEYGLAGLNIVNTRARYFGYEQLLSHQFDPYIFARSFYLKRRRSKVENRSGGQRRDSNRLPTSDSSSSE